MRKAEADIAREWNSVHIIHHDVLRCVNDGGKCYTKWVYTNVILKCGAAKWQSVQRVLAVGHHTRNRKG